IRASLMPKPATCDYRLDKSSLLPRVTVHRFRLGRSCTLGKDALHLLAEEERCGAELSLITLFRNRCKTWRCPHFACCSLSRSGTLAQWCPDHRHEASFEASLD